MKLTHEELYYVLSVKLGKDPQKARDILVCSGYANVNIEGVLELTPKIKAHLMQIEELLVPELNFVNSYGEIICSEKDVSNPKESKEIYGKVC